MKFKFILFLFMTISLAAEESKCEKLKIESKKLSCFKEEFTNQDKLLNEKFQKLKSSLEKSLVKEMVADSRAWIIRKEDLCSNELYTGDVNSSKKNSSYYSCVLGFTMGRINYLEKAFGRQNISKNISGEYNDADGGTLTLKEKKGKISFNLSIVRGPTSHGGEINGSFLFSNKKIKWETTTADGNCSLNFELKDYKIIVEEVECLAFHGMRADFSGVYRKIKE